MMFHGGGWGAYLRSDSEQKPPQVDRRLLQRVMGYTRPYIFPVSLLLLTIVVTSLVQLVPPLLYRDLIDHVLPERNIARLNLLAIAMIGIPVFTGLIGVAGRYFSAWVGEGIIYDLRLQMYEHLQRMSLRFFTYTKSGEIISRFNNDVVGAQNAIAGTIPDIVTNLITLVSTLIVMLSIEWRLALL